MGKEIRKWIKSFCNRVWRRERWKEGEMKGGSDNSNYKERRGSKSRGVKRSNVTVDTIQDIHRVLAVRVREKVEKGGILPRNQMGFRERLGTIDNIFVINYLANRQLVKKGESMTAFFVDLKAVFNLIDREDAGGSDESEED